MWVEIPFILVLTFICMIIFTAICTACLVVDTYVKISERMEEKKWGETANEILTLGTSENDEE